MKVFEIMQLKAKIEELENDFDELTGEFKDNSEEIKKLINQLDDEKENKLKAIQHIIQQKKKHIEINKEEIKQIQSFNKQEENNIILLNDLLGVLLNGENIKTNTGSFYYGKESLFIKDESLFKQNNPNYLKERTFISKEIDKQKVLEDIDKLKGAVLRKGVIFRAKKTK